MQYSAASTPEPVADEVERQRDPQGEESGDAPGRRMTAPVPLRVSEDEHRARGGDRHDDEELPEAEVLQPPLMSA